MENKGQTGTFVVGKIFENKDKNGKEFVSFLDKNSEAKYSIYKDKLGGWMPAVGDTVQALYNPGEFMGKPSHWASHLQPTVPRAAEPTRETVEDKPDWDAKDLRMAKMSALKTATEIAVAINEFKDNETARNLIIKNAEFYLGWIYAGRKDGV